MRPGGGDRPDMIYAGAYHGEWKDASHHGGRNDRAGLSTDELDLTSPLCFSLP